MNTLPQELIDRIVHYTEHYEGQPDLPPTRFSPAARDHSLDLFASTCPSESTVLSVSMPSKFPAYATISSSWKEAIEMVTFRTLDINSSEIDEFKAIVIGNRRKYLTGLSFRVLLPEYSQEACSRVESEEEQQLNNKAFTQGIRELFLTLKAWEDEGVQTALRLEFPWRPVYSPTDTFLDSQDEPYEDQNGHIGHRRWEGSLLRIVQPEMLPTLLNVQCLNIALNDGGTRKLAPPVMLDLTTSLPNLNSISWVFEDTDSKPAGVRSDNRVAFAEALKRVQFRGRSTAEIEFDYGPLPFDQRALTHQSIVPPGLTYDPLSASLRSFSQNLTTLKFRASLDSSLFWPSNDETDAAAPSWPYLRILDVTFYMLSPFGAWYFTGLRPEDHEDDNPAEGIIGGWSDYDDINYTNYREHADNTLRPFLCAFAKAVKHMPVLERYTLKSDLEISKGYFLMVYYAPGHAAQQRTLDQTDLRSRRLYFQVGHLWRPDHEIMEGLRCAGRERFGEEVIERFFNFSIARGC